MEEWEFYLYILRMAFTGGLLVTFILLLITGQGKEDMPLIITCLAFCIVSTWKRNPIAKDLFNKWFKKN